MERSGGKAPGCSIRCLEKRGIGEMKEKKKPFRDWHQTIWRWHFYAGLFAAPFLIVLAFSGAVYLFKPQIEGVLYKSQFQVEEVMEERLAPSAIVGVVQSRYPEAAITAVKNYDEKDRTVELSVMDGDLAKSVYVDPYTGKFQGELVVSDKFTELFKKLHSELIIGGTFANRLVELAACWTIILLATGLYLWWPRTRSSIWGTLLPRMRARGRLFWRDLHAVPAFWFSILILLLIMSGLPWSGVMGGQIDRLANSTHSGYPEYAHSFGDKPESKVRAVDAAEDVPWASQNDIMPVSGSGYQSLSIDDVDMIASMEHIQLPYTISLPAQETGVYTIAASHAAPWDNAALHVDQYSGAVLSDVRFSDYGVLAKAITAGIAFHEGRLFGWPNQLLGLLTCLAMILLVVSSLVMWRKRKPDGLGSPKKPMDRKVSWMVLGIMLIGGLLMPLVGISILIALAVDVLVINRIPRARSWFHGK